MPTVKKQTCTKCGRLLKETEFFKMKTGLRCELCKDCLTAFIDNRNPETFLWILKKFDVPYVKRLWTEKVNKAYIKNPAKFGPKSVIGLYLRTMNMSQYIKYGYEDSARLNGETPLTKKNQEERENKLKEQLEKGEISELEYKTSSASTIPPIPSNMDFVPNNPNLEGSKLEPTYEELLKKSEEYLKEKEKEEDEMAKAAQEAIQDLEDQAAEKEAKAAYLSEALGIDNSYFADQLTQEDVKKMILKWGTVYTPQEWITMETMYQQYANEYELNVDREEVLKKMCKTSLKMDMALDTGDITGYKSLAQVFDQLRKGGKFTEAQIKENTPKILESIGELVALCEQHGGIIDALPQYDPDEYPQDKIDFTLKDLKAYTYNLVTNELGLGDLIESYVSKLERAESDKDADMNAGLYTDRDEQEKDAVTDEEAIDFINFLENDVEAEAAMLLRESGLGDN